MSPSDVRPRSWARQIVLVDDVLTTGATASAAGECLLNAGAAKVDVVVFAIAARPAAIHT